MNWFEIWFVNRATKISTKNAAAIDKALAPLGVKPGFTAAANAELSGLLAGAIVPTAEHAAAIATLAAINKGK